MGSIFISYRRDDATGFALTLYKELSRCFKADKVFYDQEDRHHIRYGDDWFEKIQAALGTAKVFLAVIGPGWLHAVDEDGNRRLLQEEDVVRWEIEQALKRQENGELKIIPVLVNGASFPKKLDELPPSLVDLTKTQACPLPANPADFDNHFERLLECIVAVSGIPKPFPSAKQNRIFHTIDHNLTPFFSDPVGHLSQLYATLHETGKAAVTASAATATLHGMGGVGKTQLSLKYSHDFRDEYAGVWWFRADDLGKLQQDCQQFCERCGVQVYTGEEHHQAVKRWLQEQPRWLLVYDNAEAHYGERKDTLHPFLPGGDHHILITSRGNCWEGLAKSIELDVWDEEQALEFLRKRLEKATDGELRALCRALGGLPLALEQACAYIVKVGVSVDGYCRALADWEKGERLLDRKDSLATGYSHSVLATLSLAFGRLSEGAKELLRLCAWCAAEPIPEMLFRTPAMALAAVNAGKITVSAEQFEILDALLSPVLKQVARDDLIWGETVAELTGFALAQRIDVDLTPLGCKERQDDRALLLHRLTQAAVIHCISSPSSDIPSIADLLRVAFPDDILSPANWPQARVLAPHVLQLEMHSATCYVPLQVISLLLNLVASYMQAGPALYDQAAEILRRNLERYTDQYGSNNPLTLTTMNNLASTLKNAGDYQGAKVLLESALERFKEQLDPDHLSALAIMNNLADNLLIMGNKQGAKELFESVLERTKKVCGPDHHSIMTILNNLALTFKAMGDYQGAKTLQEQVLKNSIGDFGPKHLTTLTCIDNLASTLKTMGDLQGAKTLQEQVFECLKTRLAPNHPDLLVNMSNLADTLRSMGNRKAAKSLQEKVLERLTKQFGTDHSYTTYAAWNLFLTIGEMNDRTYALAIKDEYLNWLLVDGVELHSADQRKIRDMLRQIITTR